MQAQLGQRGLQGVQPGEQLQLIVAAGLGGQLVDHGLHGVALIQKRRGQRVQLLAQIHQVTRRRGLGQPLELLVGRHQQAGQIPLAVVPLLQARAQLVVPRLGAAGQGGQGLAQLLQLVLVPASRTQPLGDGLQRPAQRTESAAQGLLLLGAGPAQLCHAGAQRALPRLQGVQPMMVCLEQVGHGHQPVAQRLLPLQHQVLLLLPGRRGPLALGVQGPADAPTHRLQALEHGLQALVLAALEGLHLPGGEAEDALEQGRDQWQLLETRAETAKSSATR